MTPKRTPPLERHAAPQARSREHMSGLVQAGELTVAADGETNQRRAALARFVHAWTIEIAPHFKDEEDQLAPIIDAANRDRLLGDHTTMREVATHVLTAEAADGPLLGALGSALHDQIRSEERTLFGRIERAATGQKLDRIASRTVQIEQERPGSRSQRRL